MLAIVNTVTPTSTTTSASATIASTTINNDVSSENKADHSSTVISEDIHGLQQMSSPQNVSSGDSTSSLLNSSNINNNNDSIATTNNNQNNPVNSNQICRFFLKGICRFGTLCRFSHDVSNADDINNFGVDGPSTSTNSSLGKQNTRNTASWADAPVFVPGRIRFDLNSSINPAIANLKDCSTGLGGGIAGGEILAAGPVGPAAAQTVSCSCTGAGISGNGNGNDNVNTTANNPIVVTPVQSWASIVGGVMYSNNENAICPFEAPCPHGIYCIYPIHLELCKMCDQYCLHPTDQEQRRKHNKECLQQHEQAMELSFAIARSKDKTCGICFDVIMEKSGREKRFGILPNCNHIFCLECIRKWRQAKQFEHKITRSCPECRISSDFVCPSAFWVETKEEKDKLLKDYRAALGIKDCKYFKKGEGLCPFGNKCFYKHALPDGKLIDVGLPKRARKVRRSSTELSDLLDVFLWEFVDQRDFHWLDGLSTDSDDSDFDEGSFTSDN